MKRRNFNKSCVALLAMPLGLFKQQLPYVVTFEDGWRVMRGPDGAVHLDETLTVGTAERLKVMGDLVIANDSNRPTVMIEKGAVLRVYGKIYHLQHGQVVFQAFPYEGAEYVEITCT